MKKILFIQGGMGISGISKSLISMLHNIDYNKYEIDLMLASDKGELYSQIPQQVNVIKCPAVNLLASKPSDIRIFTKSLNFIFLPFILIRFVLSSIDKSLAAWFISRFFPRNKKRYDLAVDWQGQQGLYFLVDFVNASKKASVFHSDYTKFPFYFFLDKKYYPFVDRIFSISETCVSSLKSFFPECHKKIFILENIVSEKSISSLARKPINYFTKSTPSLVTVGHISSDKGTDLALKAALLLLKRKINFKWYFLGNSTNTAHYDNLLHELKLENHVNFLGLVVNPYPYMAKATIVVHPSQFEGKSIALDEAKLLCKPVVVTNFSTVHDQFTHGVNANICEMTPESLADAIEDLLLHPEKQKQYSQYLKEHIHDNSSEVEKLYRLID